MRLDLDKLLAQYTPEQRSTHAKATAAFAEAGGDADKPEFKEKKDAKLGISDAAGLEKPADAGRGWRSPPCAPPFAESPAPLPAAPGSNPRSPALSAMALAACAQRGPRFRASGDQSQRRPIFRGRKTQHVEDLPQLATFPVARGSIQIS